MFLIVSSYMGDLDEQLGGVVGFIDTLYREDVLNKLITVLGYDIDIREVMIETNLEFGELEPVKCFEEVGGYNQECYYVLSSK